MLIEFRERKGEKEGERGREGGGDRERHINMRNINRLPLMCTPTGDQTHSLGMCPDGESNLKPFGVWDDALIMESPSQGLRSL